MNRDNFGLFHNTCSKKVGDSCRNNGTNANYGDLKKDDFQLFYDYESQMSKLWKESNRDFASASVYINDNRPNKRRCDSGNEIQNENKFANNCDDHFDAKSFKSINSQQDKEIDE